MFLTLTERDFMKINLMELFISRFKIDKKYKLEKNVW